MKNFLFKKWLIKLILSLIFGLFSPTPICVMLGENSSCYSGYSFLTSGERFAAMGIFVFLIYFIIAYLLLSLIFVFYQKIFKKRSLDGLSH